MSDRADISKRVERAEKFLQKGKPDAALEEYLSILAEDRENDSVRQIASDLSLSVGRTQEAVTLLGQLFDRQVAMGDSARAALTYKKLARYANPTTEQKLRFGQILESSNKRLALDTYEAALQELAARNRGTDQMNVLKRIVALDPTMQNFTRLGEIGVQVGDGKGAAAAFIRVAELTEQAGGAAATWYERAYQADSANPKVALCYGRSLLHAGEAGAAIFVLEGLVQAGNVSSELRDAYSQALIAAGRLTEAEAHVWMLFEQNPTRVPQVAALIGTMINAQVDAEAVALARKLEQYQRRRGERRAFLALMQDIVAKHRASPEMLEFLVELYNASNRESDYCQTLLRLFELYFKSGNFEKAGDCLDRAAEVDPYESGHQKRLDMLRGKINEGRFNLIAARFSNVSKGISEQTRTNSEANLGSATLQDLMLQAEILVQYGMRTKAIERLQRIQELFPREEEKNAELQRLYLAAGMPTPGSAVPPAAAVVEAPAPVALPPLQVQPVAPPVAAPETSALTDVSQFSRVSEITRKLYRQSNANDVLMTIANEIGGQWKVTRCVAASRKPGQQPNAMEEYCAPGTNSGEPAQLAKLVVEVDDLTRTRGVLNVTDLFSMPELSGIFDIASSMTCTSMLAVPLTDGQDHVGVFILMHEVARGWRSDDLVVLKTIAEQAVQALNNAGLRRLVSNLSVTDAKSGLLSRSSYLDLLMGEVRRAQEDSKTLSVLLLQFGKSASMLKHHGEEAVENTMQQIGKLLAGHIRQNDFGFRYDITTVAIVLGDTTEADALLTAEKFRRLVEGVHYAGSDAPLLLTGGVAEAVIRAQFDAVDIVTELINRADHALEAACSEGPGHVKALAPSFASAAVA